MVPKADGLTSSEAFAHKADPSLEKSASWIVAFSPMFRHPLSGASRNLLNLQFGNLPGLAFQKP
jgi:hypothetical protein